MNENHCNNYPSLIQKLLNCSTSQEVNQILDDNSELVNRNLIDVMELVVKDLLQEGNREQAEFLIKLIQQQILPRTKNTPLRKAERLVMMGLYSCQGIIPGKTVADAIPCFEEALNIYTPQKFPQEWAQTKHHLGNAYLESIRGEISQNIEKSISCYSEALQVYIRHQFSQQEQAELQFNLGNAYRSRIRGKKEDNIAVAIGFYKAALKVLTRQTYPHKWAAIMNSLAAAYRDQNKLQASIDCYKAVLKIHPSQNQNEYWAKIKNNLGVTYYSDYIQGQNEDNLSEAIKCFNDALKFYTFQEKPEHWASIQKNLGGIYAHRRQGNSKENLKASIEYYTNALKVFTSKTFPQNYLKIQIGIGISYRYNQQLDKAYHAFAAAIETLESLRGEIVSSSDMEEDKKKLAGEWFHVYQHMVEICIQMGNYEQAIEYIERNKARNLVETLVNKNFYPKQAFYSQPSIYQIHCQQLDELRQTISTKQRQLEILARNQDTSEKYASEIKTISLELNELQQQKNQLIDEINQKDTSFKFTQKVESIQYQYIKKSLPDSHTAIIMWYIVHDKLISFVITPDSQNIIHWQSSQKDLKELQNWLDEYLKTYQQDKKQWNIKLSSYLQKLSQEILHLDELLSLIPKNIQQIILIPHRFLHLFPLQSLPINQETWLQFNQLDNNSEAPVNPCLLDCFKSGVRYAPSCQLLKIVQNRQLPDLQKIFAVQNPTQDLAFADLEVEIISSFFKDADVLAQEAATTEAVKNYQQLESIHCGHFSCHGEFNFASPLESALFLADSKLTLAEIFELSFQQCPLITLSACETGLIDPSSLSDEYIGLPSGFIYAGSSSVVSSLWKVNDLSTCLLMIIMIQNLQDGTDMSVSLALNKAQLWLRSATKQELQLLALKLPLSNTQKGKIRRQINKMALEKPFSSPYYWAAFTAVGK
ncbi:MAG: CHAT domain-containing protein [Cyanobacteria bacterium P01_C01_bin.38]